MAVAFPMGWKVVGVVPGFFPSLLRQAENFQPYQRFRFYSILRYQPFDLQIEQSILESRDSTGVCRNVPSGGEWLCHMDGGFQESGLGPKTPENRLTGPRAFQRMPKE
jgi:hypothetical protein